MKTNFPFIKIFPILLLAFLSQACEKDITDMVKINTKPDLVVTSFISPQDTALEVRVSKSQPVVGKVVPIEETRVRNATVRLSRGSQNVLLTYDAVRMVYRAKAALLPVVAGQTYSLQVTTPDQYAVTATCTIPVTEGVTIKNLNHSVKRTEWFGGQEYNEHTLSYEWQDASGTRQYYHLLAEREFQDPPNPGKVRFAIETDKPFVSDEGKDGLVLKGTSRFPIFDNQPDPRPATLHLYLAITDRAYYLYHQSIRQNQDTNGNPFAEPVLIYSNVKGGLGVFAGYNQIKGSLVLN